MDDTRFGFPSPVSDRAGHILPRIFYQFKDCVSLYTTAPTRSLPSCSRWRSARVHLRLGQHNCGAGFRRRSGKYLEAALAGWRVVRLGPNELTTAHVERLVALVRDGRDIHRS